MVHLEDRFSLYVQVSPRRKFTFYIYNTLFRVFRSTDDMSYRIITIGTHAMSVKAQAIIEQQRERERNG